MLYLKLGKLPELADNIKRRMSDQLRPVNPGTWAAPPTQDTPDDTDEDDLAETVSSDITTTTRRTSMFLHENKSKNNSGAIFVLSR